MSARANQNESSQNQKDNQSTPSPEEIAANPELKTIQPTDPKAKAELSVASAGSELSQGQIIANAIDAIMKANPGLSADEAGALVLGAMKSKDSLKAKVDKEVAMIVPINKPEKTVFLKKDKKGKFPIAESALSSVVCRQTRTRVVDGEEVEVPARDLNEIGIYTEEDFKKFSEKGGLFEQQKINVEVWHKPGDDDSIAE